MHKVWIGEVKAGKIVFTPFQEASMADWCKLNEGKMVRMAPVNTTRSVQQNKLLWMYYAIIAEETGHTPEEIHQWAKGKFLTSGYSEVFGSKVRKTKSTTELSKVDFSDYLDRICAETNVPIPDTESYHYYVDSAPLINENDTEGDNN